MRITRKLHRTMLCACLAVAATALWVPAALADDGENGSRGENGPGAVYVQTNTAPVNYVVVFDRASNGTLSAAGRFATGGAGKPAANPPLGIPFLDSAGSVTLSADGRFLFVVNAGDNTVSSFRVGEDGLTLADTKPSFGVRPVSSTSHDDLLYVVNSDPAASNISGYRVGERGRLRPIPGSVRPISDPALLPAQIQFDARGKLLAVSERPSIAVGSGNGVISTYAIGKNGAAGPAVAHPSSDRGPFGIAFTHANLMIVSNEHFPDVFAPPLLSSVSSYGVSKDGSVVPIDTQLAHAGGACWNVITGNDKFVFVTSPFTANINSFRIGRDGNLIPVNGTSVVATAPGATLDEALSGNSKYLYVLDSAGFASSVVDEYAVNKDGTITLIGSTTAFEGSASGTAAW